MLGSQRCVVGEGMPTYKRPFEKGNLYIKFEVVFPRNNFVDSSHLKVIASC
jgi:DnaJ family protein A protein 2